VGEQLFGGRFLSFGPPRIVSFRDCVLGANLPVRTLDSQFAAARRRLQRLMVETPLRRLTAERIDACQTKLLTRCLDLAVAVLADDGIELAAPNMRSPALHAEGHWFESSTAHLGAGRHPKIGASSSLFPGHTRPKDTESALCRRMWGDATGL